MTRFARILLFASFLWGWAGTLPARAAPGQVSAAPPLSDSLSPTDFPPYDAPIGSAQQYGLAAKALSERLAQTPDAAEMIRVLGAHGRIDDAFDVLSRIVSGPPGRMVNGFVAIVELAANILPDDFKDYVERLRDLAGSARARLPELSREDGARLARELLAVENLARGGSSEVALRFREFQQQYAGTEEASFAEVTLLANGPRSSFAQQLEALDAFARAHPGTVVGAKALYLRGFQLHVNAVMMGLEPSGSDPTDRFMKVVGIVNELESGAYPPCEWIEKAPSLVIEFFAFEPKYSTKNLDRVIEAYQRFVATHFTVHQQDPLEFGAGYLITSKLAELYKLKGVGAAGVQRTFTELERVVPDPSGVRYLAALYGNGLNEDASPAQGAALARKSNDMLLALSAGNSAYARKALATLASQQFYERDYIHAIQTYRTFLTAYPQSPWAWVAVLRIGQSQAESGDWAAAVTSFRRAALEYASVPMARVIGHAYAARASEALGQFGEALADDRQALEAWDTDYGSAYSLRVNAPPTAASLDAISADVVRDDISDRAAVLSQSLEAPGGALLERGRWLVQQHKWNDARAALEQLPALHPGSPVLSEARSLAHRARLEYALELADIENSRHNERAALRELSALARERSDFSAYAATIARAAILWKQGAATEAQALMKDALSGWHAQQPTSETVAENTVEEDVMAIRNVVFRPAGGGVYGAGGWNAFTWPRTAARFLVVNPDLSVKLFAGETIRVRCSGALPGLDNVLFFDNDQIRFFSTMISHIGGNRRRQPTAVMETPNQPIGSSLDILALLNRFFAARPGHWGGWEFETYPAIGQIEFLNAERTRATAAVIIGYSGTTVVLEKKDGIWRATGLTKSWVT